MPRHQVEMGCRKIGLSQNRRQETRLQRPARVKSWDRDHLKIALVTAEISSGVVKNQKLAALVEQKIRAGMGLRGRVLAWQVLGPGFDH